LKRTRRTFIKRNSTAVSEYFCRMTTDSRVLRNTANYYIRNLRTCMAKDKTERTEKENEVIEIIDRALLAANKKAAARKKKCLEAAEKATSPEEKERFTKKAEKIVFFKRPADGLNFLSYEALDAICKAENIFAYRDMPAQVNQQSLKKTAAAWKAYRAAAKNYFEAPQKYTGMPQIPGYIRKQGASAVWTSQMSRLFEADGREYVLFGKGKVSVCIGKASQFAGVKYVQTEVVPTGDGFYVLTTTDDGVKETEAPIHPERILGIDLGVGNLASCVSNFEMYPFLIRGGAVKSVNQWFNKERARLISVLTHGSDSRHSRKKSRALTILSRKREFFLSDFFWKAAWYIVRQAKNNRVQVIVVGKNNGWKQNTFMGTANNQSFVSIPYTKFLGRLRTVAAKNGIALVETEERYTSKASLIDRDSMTFTENKKKQAFSGTRVKRGLYRTKNGICLNADINGAGNIIRKAYSYAFDSVKDYSYMWKTTVSVGFRDLYQQKPKAPKRYYAQKCGKGAHIRHQSRAVRRTELLQVFGVTTAKKKPSSGKKETAKAAKK